MKNLREAVSGLYFPPDQALTTSTSRDQHVFGQLCKAAANEKKYMHRAEQLLLHCNKHWDLQKQVTVNDFWQTLGQYKGFEEDDLDWDVARDIAIAMVKGRQRYLVRYPSKGEHINTMMLAYIQRLLENLQLDPDHRLGDDWALSQQDRRLAMMNRQLMGPAQQISRNRFRLSATAPQLLHPIAEITGQERSKADFLGLADTMIGREPLIKSLEQKRRHDALALTSSPLTPPTSVKRALSPESMYSMSSSSLSEGDSIDSRPLKRTRTEESEPPRSVEREAVPNRLGRSASPEIVRRRVDRHAPSLFIPKRRVPGPPKRP